VFFDNRPCDACGAEVRLTAREHPSGTTEPDGTIDVRVCTNADCTTNQGTQHDESPATDETV
jgi:hypothetical protein